MGKQGVKIEIMDTTLRDGEQTSGVSFVPHEKLMIARLLLEDLKVDRVEVASARVSEGEFEAVKMICDWAARRNLLQKVEVLGFVDGHTSVDWIQRTGCRVINLLCKGSLKHCTQQLKKTPEEHIADIINVVHYADEQDIGVNVYLEDWSNGMKDSPEYVFQLMDGLKQTSIRRYMLPDTLGILNPLQVIEYMRKMKKRYPNTHFDFHAHNDYDLAVYECRQDSRRVMSEANAYILTSMLKSVVTEGTGHRLNTLDIPIAGKTGTVGLANGNRDAWMAGYTPEYTAVVWQGYDSDRLGLLPSSATGGTYPALMLYELFNHIYPDGRSGDFEKPESVKQYSIDAKTLKKQHKAVLANAMTPQSSRVTEYFTEESAPEDVSGYLAVPGSAQNLLAVREEGGVMVSFDCPDDFGMYTLWRSEAGKAEKPLMTWNGREGHIEYIDAAVKPGKGYRYRVTVKHEELLIGDEPVEGLTTRYAFVPAGLGTSSSSINE